MRGNAVFNWRNILDRFYKLNNFTRLYFKKIKFTIYIHLYNRFDSFLIYLSVIFKPYLESCQNSMYA